MWWLFHSFQQINLFLIQHLKCLLCCLERRHSFSQIMLTILLDQISSINRLLDYLLLTLNTLLQNISRSLILLHLFHLHLCIYCCLFEFWLQLNQIFLHYLDIFLSVYDLLVTVLVFEDICLDLFPFLP